MKPAVDPILSAAFLSSPCIPCAAEDWPVPASEGPRPRLHRNTPPDTDRKDVFRLYRAGGITGAGGEDAFSGRDTLTRRPACRPPLAAAGPRRTDKTGDLSAAESRRRNTMKQENITNKRT